MRGKEIEWERFERIRWLIFVNVSIFYSCKNFKGKLVYILLPFSSSYLLNKELLSFHLLRFSCHFPSPFSFSSFSPILISKYFPTCHFGIYLKHKFLLETISTWNALHIWVKSPIIQISSMWILDLRSFHQKTVSYKSSPISNYFLHVDCLLLSSLSLRSIIFTYYKCHQNLNGIDQTKYM